MSGASVLAGSRSKESAARSGSEALVTVDHVSVSSAAMVNEADDPSPLAPLAGACHAAWTRVAIS